MTTRVDRKLIDWKQWEINKQLLSELAELDNSKIL